MSEGVRGRNEGKELSEKVVQGPVGTGGLGLFTLRDSGSPGGRWAEHDQAHLGLSRALWWLLLGGQAVGSKGQI